MGKKRRGILTPFVRDKKRDFASGEGGALLRSDAGQVFGMRRGELLWRTEVGTELERLRHHQNSDVVRELGRVYTRDAVRRWLPSAELTAFAMSQEDATLRGRITLRDGDDEETLEVNR
jgi:uncharacterized protein